MKSATPPIEKHSSGLLRSSGVVSIMTLLSRVLGLVRDMVIANFFGASAGADAFFLAFRIPNFFRRLFGEGAFAQAFVPVLAEYQTEKSFQDVRLLVSAVSGTLGVNLFFLSLVGVIGAPAVISLFAAGFVYAGDVTKISLATEMLRLTFPYVFFICMTAFAGAVLNSYGRFAVPSLTPIFLNLSLISAAIFLTPLMTTPVIALAWGVLFAGFLQFSFQLPFLWREGLLVKPRLDLRHPGVKKVLHLMLPALLGVSVGQINLLLDTVLASFLETGSLSWLYYSDRLLELPLALFGITIATVILPSLSRQQATEPNAFNETLGWAVKMVCLIGIPSSIALVILSESLITTLFYQGEMTPRDVTMASYSLAAYGIGLLGHMLVKVLAPGYFSRQDTRTPVRFGIAALITNMVLNLILVWHLKHAGLALATSLAAFLNAGLLWYGLSRTGLFRLPNGWWKFISQLVFANLVLVAFLIMISPQQSDWLAMAFWMRLGWMLGICGLGFVIYGLSLLLTGLRYRDIVR